MNRWQKAGARILLSWLLFLFGWVAGSLSTGDLSSAAFAEPAPSSEVRNRTEPSLLGQNLNMDDISTEKISQFVQAYLQVLHLVESREAELQGAELESESQQIQREIEAQALGLIQAAGLTLQEYLQLLSLTNIDPEFGERVAAQLQEANE